MNHKIRIKRLFKTTKKQAKLDFRLVVLSILLCLSNVTWSYENNYLIGRGIHDVTGPAAEVGLMGYANPDQKSAGIHSRQWSRAFIVAEPDTQKTIAFVSVDAGALFQSVFTEVIARLNTKYGDLYNERNVVLSATHTHAAVGGQSHYALYDITILGFIQQAFDAQVDGIVASIEKAHNDLKPGHILVNKGNLTNASYNRSIVAYENNPEAEKQRHGTNIQPEMTVLKLIQAGAQEAGMISWFATHPNAMGKDIKLLSGDNKGHASYLFEKKLKGSTYQSKHDFVAAFAISNAGDMSPNVEPDNEGRGPTSDRLENVHIIGKRQYEKALSLYNQASEQLTGSIDFSHQYVDFSSTQVSADFTGGLPQKTCEAALGESFAAGTEDGRGPDLFGEGDTSNNPFLQFITGALVAPITQDDKNCHGSKSILVAQGKASPYPWSPEVLPLSIQKIGQLGILAVPAEFTVMSGRRLMETVQGVLGDTMGHLVVAGLSNAYSGYVTTKEEYDMQHYEGGSTHFGPWTLAAYQQSFYQLATAILPADQSPATSLSPAPFPALEPVPRDLTGETINFQTGVIHDQAPIFKRIGDTVQDANSSYYTGQTVEVKFWSGHPKNNLRTQGTFLEVQKWNGANWTAIASDNDWETTYQWKRIDGFWGTSHAILTWSIPSETSSGYYRLKHYGDQKKPWTGKISAYTGTSRYFYVH
jgi:neutral ceramidase